MSRGICFPGQELCTLVVESQALAFPLCGAVAAPVRMGLSPSLPQWDKCRQQKVEVRRQQKAGGRVTRCEHPSRVGPGPGGQCWRCLRRGQMAV